MVKNVQKSFPNHLGEMFREYRKHSGMTQKDVATGACISVPTVRLLEQGRGYYTSFTTVCERYGLRIVGQHLPQGDCIGKQLQLLRKARGYSQASLASMT